ncbi:MAG TPA: hypothetical protein VGD65_01095 [Chryseosolibacter sp.]
MAVYSNTPAQDWKWLFKSRTWLFKVVQGQTRNAMDAEDLLLQECKNQIERKIGWENSESWTNHDFQTLSDRIQQETGVNLSIATLKRIWGKVKYDSKPTITTLNTLAKFLGHEGWRAFRQANSGQRTNEKTMVEPTVDPPPSVPSRRKHFVRSGLIGTALCSVIVLFLIYGFNRNATPETKSYKLTSKKVVSEGVPNSVVFDYDASESTSDSIFIQQSWDERLRTQVSKDQHQHTSIYYTPGFFQAKLVVDKQIVREHNLMITSKGWLALVKLEGPVPVYFKDEDFRKGEMLSLSASTVQSKNIPFQPEPPVVSFYNVKDFGGIHTNDFKFEARVRNDYAEGAGACQFSQILLLTEGNVIVVPLSIKGCVSDIGLFFNSKGVNGKTADLSAFGADLSQWVNVKIEVKNQKGQIYINENLAYESPWNSSEKIVGMIFRFQGAGSIDHVRLASTDNEYVFEDAF